MSLHMQMAAVTLDAMPMPRMPAKIRFDRGIDEHGSYLMCMVLGPKPDRNIYGMLRYADGATMPPAPVREEERNVVLTVFGIE